MLNSLRSPRFRGECSLDVFSPHHLSAVGLKQLTGDIARALTQQEINHGRDVLRLPKSLHRESRLVTTNSLFPFRRCSPGTQERSIDRSRSDRIDSNPVRREFYGK